MVPVTMYRVLAVLERASYGEVANVRVLLGS